MFKVKFIVFVQANKDRLWLPKNESTSNKAVVVQEIKRLLSL